MIIDDSAYGSWMLQGMSKQILLIHTLSPWVTWMTLGKDRSSMISAKSASPKYALTSLGVEP